jgi:hypothetical protein
MLPALEAIGPQCGGAMPRMVPTYADLRRSAAMIAAGGLNIRTVLQCTAYLCCMV